MPYASWASSSSAPRKATSSASGGAVGVVDLEGLVSFEPFGVVRASVASETATRNDGQKAQEYTDAHRLMRGQYCWTFEDGTRAQTRIGRPNQAAMPSTQRTIGSPVGAGSPAAANDSSWYSMSTASRMRHSG